MPHPRSAGASQGAPYFCGDWIEHTFADLPDQLARSRLIGGSTYTDTPVSTDIDCASQGRRVVRHIAVEAVGTAAFTISPYHHITIRIDS